jgi:ATP-binding protein involved in chromosome partitioning
MKKHQSLFDHIWFVGSGKGGVGKSTIALNIAVALGKQGYDIGFLDADIYGPSAPQMLGLRHSKPDINQNEIIAPFYKFGIRSMSVGFLMEDTAPGVWRGPVLHTILQRMISGVDWGHCNVLIVDLPPGTGDVLLSLSSLLPQAGIITVTMPQEVATQDAMRFMNAGQRLNLSLMGVVENFSGFTTPEGKKHWIFGKGKGEELAKNFQCPFLGSFEILPQVSQSASDGVPIAFHCGEGDVAGEFSSLSKKILEQTTMNPFSCH